MLQITTAREYNKYVCIFVSAETVLYKLCGQNAEEYKENILRKI